MNKKTQVSNEKKKKKKYLQHKKYSLPTLLKVRIKKELISFELYTLFFNIWVLSPMLKVLEKN